MKRFFSARREFGELESKVMEVLWAAGESSVRDVAERLGRPLAYTTVMTTLDRLFKKGLLERRKEDRAYFYAAKFSRRQWDEKRAGDWLAGLLAENKVDVLASCLVNAVNSTDAALLDELEKKIRQKRKELEGGRR